MTATNQTPDATNQTPAKNVVNLQKNGMASAVSVDIAKLPQDIVNKLVAFGLQEKASNALAGAKKNEWDAQERTKRVQDLVDSLVKGEWSTRVAGASGLSPIDAEIARLVYEQAKVIVGAQCDKPEDGFPRAKTAWLEAEFTVTESGKTLKGQAVVDMVMGNAGIMEKINATAKETIAKKEAEAKAREAIAISL